MNTQKICLLVEDDIDDQELFKIALRSVKERVTCIVANNGIEALQQIAVEKELVPDIIFLDFNMPKMNGLECLELMRKLPHLSGVKIFVYSTSESAGLVAKSTLLGADGFFVKLADMNVFSEKLRAIFKGEIS